METGDAVVYERAGGGMGGLEDGETYYGIVDDADTIRLATTRSLALSGISDINVDVPETGAAGHGFRKAGAIDLTAVSEATIWSLTLAGSGGGAGGAGGGVAITGAGSGSVNTVTNKGEVVHRDLESVKTADVD